MVERLKTIAREIRRGENIDLYLTILLAIVVGVLGVFGVVGWEKISAVILATLALLAGSLLTNRRTADGLTAALGDIKIAIEKLINRRCSLNDLFKKRAELPTLQQQLEDAQSIEICGMSQLAVATTYRSFLLQKVRAGCTLRLLMLNPKNQDLMDMIEPFVPNHNVQEHTRAILLALDYLEREQELFNSPLVEICLYDKPLAHAMLVINRQKADARVRVEMYMRSTEPAESPGFYVFKKDEPSWFRALEVEFDDHWTNAKPYRPTTTEQHSAGV